MNVVKKSIMNKVASKIYISNSGKHKIQEPLEYQTSKVLCLGFLIRTLDIRNQIRERERKGRKVKQRADSWVPGKVKSDPMQCQHGNRNELVHLGDTKEQTDRTQKLARHKKEEFKGF